MGIDDEDDKHKLQHCLWPLNSNDIVKKVYQIKSDTMVMNALLKYQVKNQENNPDLS